jgi:hypothetical protein
VSLSIVEDGPEPVVRLAADPAWLADPIRAYPVVIDPTVRLIGSNADTTIRKAAPTTNYGSDPLLVLKGGSDVHRILYKEDLFEAVGTALSVAGTVAGVASIPLTGGASLALGAAAVGLGTAGGAVQCGAKGATAAAGIGIIGGGVAGTFTKGGLGAAGTATNLGGEVANYAIC